ncbi:MAG: hypothetical protein ACRDYB_11730, partial [Acidimicrobiales bacterium]
MFDVAAVESLARRNRPSHRSEGRLATVATSVTELRAEGPAYRGRLAVDLVATEPFEAGALHQRRVLRRRRDERLWSAPR